MKSQPASLLLSMACLVLGAAVAPAQLLGPQFKTISDGIHVYVGKNNESNCTIILTQDGVVLIDSGNNPSDSRNVLAAVKQLTPQAVRLLLNTEPHNDHTTGHFVFSPPAVIVAAAGGGAAMKNSNNAQRIAKLIAENPSLRAEFEGWHTIVPHVEYQDRTTLNVGERSFELHYLKNVHSESDSAIWLPKERVLFPAASVAVKRFNNMRTAVSIPDTQSAIKMMKALNPAVVVPGHGAPGGIEVLTNYERYLDLLMERVGQMVRQGKTLEQIKAELKMPELDDWAGKDRFPNNIEAAYRAIKG